MILDMTKYDEYREKFIERKTIEDIPKIILCFLYFFSLKLIVWTFVNER